MHKLITFLVIAAALSLAGCRQSLPPPAPPAPTALPATPTPTPEPAAIPLAPFTHDGFAISGVVPQDWAEFKPGWFAPAIDAQGQIALAQAAYPHTSAEWGRFILARLLKFPEPPAKSGTRQTANLTWDLYAVEGSIAGSPPLAVDVALAEQDSTLYMIVLQSPKADRDALYQEVFLPAVDALNALEPVQADSRDRLTATELMAAEAQDASPVRNLYFTPLGDQAPARHRLEGTLTVPEFKMQTDALNEQATRPGHDYFPGFSSGFFTDQGYLVPVSQDILPATGERSYWKVILSPGQVWSEPGDGGLSRAALPFVLVAEDSNETHNGLATFLFDDTRVSSFRIQVIQETVPWNKNTYSGQNAMTYAPGAVEGRDALAAQFAEELARQTPIRPWSELEEMYGAQQLLPFTGAADLFDISATGVVLSDTIYLQPCHTTYGEFPYCRDMRHGSFSVTKSMGAAVAMLRLAQKYGPEVFDLKISDYVDVNAKHDGWENVTFGDALNMATGIGDNPELTDITAEENQPKFYDFMTAKSADEKLAVIATYGVYPWERGAAARYNSINTFVLSVAMDRFLKSKEGPQADIWDMVLEEVYKPIGIYHAPIMRTIEPDGSRGVPILGYGLYPTIDDVAKVAQLLQRGGQAEGQQLLHADKLAEALRQTNVAGLPTGQFNQNGEGRYHMAFWSFPYSAAQGKMVQVPYMSGHGGNLVVLNPNGVVSFRFADGFDYNIEPMVSVAQSILP